MHRQTLISLTSISLLVYTASTHANEMNYRVWAGDREIGTHTFTVQREGAITNVLSEAFYNVKVLFVNVYKYKHTAQETWLGNCLTSLVSSTLENSEQTDVTARQVDDEFVVERNNEQLPVGDECIGSYAYWDRQRLKRDTIINPQTGEISPAEVTDIGRLPMPRLETEADAIQINTDEFNLRVWYSDEGDWLALESEAQGQNVVYLKDSLLPPAR